MTTDPRATKGYDGMNDSRAVNDSRTVKAYDAMKDLGISKEEVKPVLRNLLKVYDKNWELIEDDNYRTLIDAYFESKEDKPEEHKRKAPINSQDGERPKQKLHVADRDNRVPSAVKSIEVLPVEDNDKPPKTLKQKSIKSFQTSSSHKLLSQRRLSDDERISSLPSMAARGQKSYPGAASSAGLYSEEPSHPSIQRKNMSSDQHQKKITTSGTEKPKFRVGTASMSCNGSLDASNGNLSIKSLSKVLKSGRYVDDITKGSENVKVSLLDETESEEFPKFNYIPCNVIYQCANVNISLARIADEGCCADCSGDCLSLSFPCACSQETGGEFAYSSNGLLKEKFLTDCINEPQAHHYVYCKECPIERSKNESKPEPCRGHLVRKFIKECWKKCGCDMQCGNRVVQRGLSRKLQVFLTDQGKGWGVRSLEDLPKGSFVCEYAGEILTNTELYDRIVMSTGNDRHTYPVTLDADWGSEVGLKDEEALCLDATHNGNVARFINHRCTDSNLIDIPVEVETPDRHYYHLALFTKRNVSAYEELTWDYGIDFDDHTHPIKAFKCCCGSALCRDKKQKGQFHY
ncbi:hypothetical protein KIW84_063889 [Lathyrus oleraceus]|uniref:Histone-lysine N-methyltransferase SUVR4 n=1 Tax=Pisum sativum TaxID=3888 RepID=A0A9D4WCU5_PEA|nr:hypothetical protein KIW84_063889 [Pisum sativum]